MAFNFNLWCPYELWNSSTWKRSYGVHLLLCRIGHGVWHPLERSVILSTDFVSRCQLFELLHGLQGGQVHLPCPTGRMGVLWRFRAQSQISLWGVHAQPQHSFPMWICHGMPQLKEIQGIKGSNFDRRWLLSSLQKMLRTTWGYNRLCPKKQIRRIAPVMQAWMNCMTLDKGWKYGMMACAFMFGIGIVAFI